MRNILLKFWSPLFTFFNFHSSHLHLCILQFTQPITNFNNSYYLRLWVCRLWNYYYPLMMILGACRRVMACGWRSSPYPHPTPLYLSSPSYSTSNHPIPIHLFNHFRSSWYPSSFYLFSCHFHQHLMFLCNSCPLLKIIFYNYLI